MRNWGTTGVARRRALLLGAAALVLLARPGASSEGSSAEGRPEARPFSVTATLVDPKGSPVAGERLYVVLWVAGRATWQIVMENDRLVPAAPSGVSDNTGRVEVKVPREFVERNLPLTTSYAVGLIRDGKFLPAGQEGVGFVFELALANEAGGRIELETTVVKLNT